jgi:hypothetical protein
MRFIKNIFPIILILILTSSCDEIKNSEIDINYDELVGFWDIDFVDIDFYEKQSGEELSVFLRNEFNISDDEINDILLSYIDGNEREYSGIRYHFRVDNIYTYDDDSGYHAEGLWKVDKENSTLSLSPYDEYNNSSDVTLDLEKITSETLIISAPENYRQIIEGDTINIDATLFLNFIKNEPF